MPLVEVPTWASQWNHIEVKYSKSLKYDLHTNNRRKPHQKFINSLIMETEMIKLVPRVLKEMCNYTYIS